MKFYKRIYMCLAVPMKLTTIDGDTGVAEYEGITVNVNLMFIDNPKVGNYVIIHAGYAIQKLGEQEAEETIELFREIDKESRKRE